MSITIPNSVWKRAAAICDQFPIIDFPTIAEILYYDSMSGEAASDDLFSRMVTSEPAPITVEEKIKKRDSRKRAVRARIDGEMYIAPTRKNLCKQIGLESAYDQIFHTGHANVRIHEEADRLAKAIYENFHSELTEYYSFGFDGKLYCAFLKDGICERIEEVRQ